MDRATATRHRKLSEHLAAARAERRLPPRCMQTERSVLCSTLVDRATAEQALSLLTWEDFLTEAHRSYWIIACSLQRATHPDRQIKMRRDLCDLVKRLNLHKTSASKDLLADCASLRELRRQRLVLAASTKIYLEASILAGTPAQWCAKAEALIRAVRSLPSVTEDSLAVSKPRH